LKVFATVLHRVSEAVHNLSTNFPHPKSDFYKKRCGGFPPKFFVEKTPDIVDNLSIKLHILVFLPPKNLAK
jgi:hypothetical protein